ncbi:MAG: hypothetical protein AAGG51_08500 [Cyanobacteria bacterium P01_G01_bin.54]
MSEFEGPQSKANKLNSAASQKTAPPETMIGAWTKKKPRASLGPIGDSKWADEIPNAKNNLLAHRPTHNNHLRIDSVWIPSTGTISVDSEYQQAENLRNATHNPHIRKQFVGVLAPAGTTIDLPPHNSANPNPLSPEFLQGKIPWLEGTGYVTENSDFFKAFSEEEDGTLELSNEIIGYDQKHDAYYLDILDDDVWNLIKNFIENLMRAQPFIRTIIIDDHFGIHSSTEQKMFEKYEPLVRGEVGRDPTEQELREHIRDGVTDRIWELSELLHSYRVKLSVSVNRFDFKRDNMALGTSERSDPRIEDHWDNAMRTNYHDVAQWIEDGSITGEVNVQLYRPTIEDVKNEFNQFKEAISDVLSKRDADYVNRFPEVSVSIATVANGKTISRPEINKLINYLRDKSTIDVWHGQNLIRKLVIEIAGWHGTDFHNIDHSDQG